MPPNERSADLAMAPTPRLRYVLAHLFGTAADGVRDHLTDFSRPVTGAYSFAPSLNALNELARP
jgi:hypothetical protein